MVGNKDSASATRPLSTSKRQLARWMLEHAIPEAKDYLFVAWMLPFYGFWRAPRVSTFGRWFLLGLLIGLGMMSLIEGACFMFGS